MKRFLKFVAALLAMTLIIGTVPVMAAASFTYKTPRALFVGGCKGTKSSGKKATYKSYVKATKLVEGFDSKTMTLKVKSSDTSVASVSKTKITAKKPGKATVTITVYDSKGKQLDSGSVVITVKKNASASDLTYKGITNGATYNTGDKVTVSLPLGTDTDKRRLTAKTNNITVKSAGTRKWTVTFDKAGAFELLAEAYQSATYKGTTASQTIKGTVEDEDKPLVIDVKQTGLKTFVISGLKEEIEKDDIKFYTDEYDTMSKNKIHTVVYSAKENTATVTLYNDTDLSGTDYKGGTVFYVEVDGSKASFKAVPATLADVDKFELVTRQVKATENTPLEFKYYSNDVEITDAVKSLINPTNLETDLVRDGLDAFVSSNSIYFGAANLTAEIKATLTIGFDEKTFKPITITCFGVVQSITDSFNSNILYTVTNDDGVYMTSKTPMVSDMMLGENPCFEALFEFTNKTYKNFTETGYTIKSNNEDVVMIKKGKSESGGFLLDPVNTGNATILIYTEDGKTIVATVPVSVKEARRATSFTITPNKNYLNTNTTDPLISDAIRITAVAKDQYGDVYPGANFTIRQDDNTKAATGTVSSLSFNSYGLCVINGSDVSLTGKAHTIILYATCTDIKGATEHEIRINVDNVPATDVESKATVEMVVEGEKRLDTTLKVGTQEVKNATVTANFKINNYFVREGIGSNLTFVPKSGTDPALTASALGITEGTSALYFTVALNGKVINPSAAEYSTCMVYDSSSIEFRPIVSGKKLPAGNYAVTVYRIKPMSGHTLVTRLGSTDVIVTESTADIEVSREAFEAVGSPLDMIKACYKVIYEGTDVTSSIAADSEYAGPSTEGTIVVKKIKVSGLYNSIYGTFSVEIDVPREEQMITTKK